MSEEQNVAPSAVEGTKIAQKEITPAVGANNSDNEQLQEPVEKRQRLSPRNDNILHKETRKVHFQATLDDKSKFRKRRGPPIEDRSNLENDHIRGERMKLKGPLRKRSHSFSEGGHAKHLPPAMQPSIHVKNTSGATMRRWKSGRLIGGGGGGGKGRGGAGNVLPSEFLLGGNIHDPLNLNSLSDEKLRMVSSLTPESSPLPTPKHRKTEYKIEVLIPPNISDPLNLNAGGNDKDFAAKLISPLSKKKKVRHRNRTKKRFPALDISKLPGPTPKEGEDESGDGSTEETKQKEGGIDAENKEKEVVIDEKKVPVKLAVPQKEEPKKKENRFVHGNYNRYYGYRNPGQQEDPRIKHLKAEWFQQKKVLDIGCNIGHMTISIGKMSNPVRIVGVDIDKELIRIARKNIRHYMDTRPNKKTRYPRCFGKQFGALNPLGIDAQGEKMKEFPHNVEFYCTNYVPENDQLLEIVQQEFDSILCLSTTKWMHLNNGDAGLKRAFKKMYAQLKPGGVLILEAQSFSNYGKRKNLSETILKNFKEIKFRPEQFADFLLTEVGFNRCEVVAIPSHSSKGFQRPLQVFIKGAESETSNSTTPCSYGISPQSHTYNPAFTPFYGKFTPGSAYTPSQSQRTPAEETDKRVEPGNPAEFLYPGPSHLYSGPTPGGYSANSTPSGFTPGTTPHGGRYSANSTPSHLPTTYNRGPNKLPVYTGISFPSPGNLVSSPVYGLHAGPASPQADDTEPSTSTAAPHNTPAPVPPSPSPPSISSEDQTPSYTPQYTPSYTPAHPGHHSQGNTPVYSGPQLSPSGGPSSPLYSPGNATPLVSYSPSQYSPEAIGPGYSPSASGANYSPDTAGPNYSPDTVSGGVAYSPAEPNYSPDTMRPSSHSGGGYLAGGGIAGGSGAGTVEPSYSPDTVGPGYSPSGPAYSPSGSFSPAYSPSSGMISSPQGYSPSFQRSPATYSPHSPAPVYSPHSPAPAYSPQPNYSPGNATPLCTRSPFPSPNTAPLSTRSPMPSPSIQAPEVSGNTTPHPGPSESPLSSSPRPHRYSWSGANLSGRNTPVEERAGVSNPPSVDANPPSVEANPPSVDANPPSVEANPPSVDANPPSVEANPPSVDTNPPSVDANPPSMDANPLSVDANPPSVDTNSPSLDANQPLMDDIPLSVDANANPPSENANPPSVDVNPPSVYANSTSMEVNPPSVDTNQPLVDANTPLVVANIPSVDANPPSEDANLPSVANSPNVETNTTSVEGFTPSVDLNPISVDDNPPQEEVNPQSFDSNQPPLDVNPPCVDANPTTEETNPQSKDINLPSIDTNSPISDKATPTNEDVETSCMEDNLVNVDANSPNREESRGSTLETPSDLSPNNAEQSNTEENLAQSDCNIDKENSNNIETQDEEVEVSMLKDSGIECGKGNDGQIDLKDNDAMTIADLSNDDVSSDALVMLEQPSEDEQINDAKE